MSKSSERAVANVLLQEHGKTFADEIGIKLGRGTAESLFRLLCASLLFSARISSDISVRAAKALADKGWTTPQKMLSATWEERAKTLNESGYARYDERTSTMLADTSQLIVDRYDGDLSKLREAAGRDPARERKLLKELKGIGDVGVDIFFREVQEIWDEVFPFIDKRASASAKQLGLPTDANALSKLVDKRDFPRLVAALVRAQLRHDHDDILRKARDSG